MTRLRVLSVASESLVVTRLDRLGRSLRDLANIAHEIESSGASLRVLEQSVDTATSAGQAFFGMLLCLPNLKPTCAASARRRASPRFWPIRN